MANDLGSILDLANVLRQGCLTEAAFVEAFYHTARKPLEEDVGQLKRVIAAFENGYSYDKLRQQLAAAQADNERLRDALRYYADGNHWTDGNCHEYGYSQHDPVIERGTVADEALDQPADTSALESMIAKAGEVMRDRCVAELYEISYRAHANPLRALPGVTLEDLQK